MNQDRKKGKTISQNVVKKKVMGLWVGEGKSPPEQTTWVERVSGTGTNPTGLRGQCMENSEVQEARHGIKW